MGLSWQEWVQSAGLGTMLFGVGDTVSQLCEIQLRRPKHPGGEGSPPQGQSFDKCRTVRHTTLSIPVVLLLVMRSVLLERWFGKSRTWANSIRKALVANVVFEPPIYVYWPIAASYMDHHIRKQASAIPPLSLGLRDLFLFCFPCTSQATYRPY